jgi:hypothetical protein
MSANRPFSVRRPSVGPASSYQGQEMLAFPSCVLREFETPLTRDLKYGVED